ncbi:Predicted DNA-binding transcriptional regulator YafY, contains an HTH and WYL domains [Gemmobacter aquatilis]|uniref:Predicted DNA-binding transcriptional regulator YafY, contains an HTH and WYL domains n=1 Tax=Gemmobacter aquatilis TaxID=933059 RepID=A0A1H7ZPM8_9RHOB|nr:YafY family protein [Gemmobacter aquatilis]SEM59367.1 Predicted DNA-binding transcriptional regulator YafY, contains an HTH and WYL domains [Gemmobacter aquatilis]
MGKPDRLFRLLDALRRLPQPVTAARLAAEMEVSPRTLYRDMASLRAGGALIEGEAGLGYTLREDPALPPQMFTRLEVEALMLGLAEVRMAGDAALARAAEMAGAKIVASLPERVQRQAIHAAQEVYRFDRRVAPPHLGLLREAVWEERAVDLRYRDTAGQESARRIWPLSIVWLDRSLMLLAWCCLRQDFRRFKLESMAAVTVSDESFRPRRVALLREFHRQLRGG